MTTQTLRAKAYAVRDEREAESKKRLDDIHRHEEESLRIRFAGNLHIILGSVFKPEDVVVSRTTDDLSGVWTDGDLRFYTTLEDQDHTGQIYLLENCSVPECLMEIAEPVDAVIEIADILDRWGERPLCRSCQSKKAAAT